MTKIRLMVWRWWCVSAQAAFAQEQVTIVRRNSERISGRFEDWVRADRHGLRARVGRTISGGLAMGDILVIAVAGHADNLPANEIEAAHGADHMLVTQAHRGADGPAGEHRGRRRLGSAERAAQRDVPDAGGGERRFRLHGNDAPLPGQLPAADGARRPRRPRPRRTRPCPRAASACRRISSGRRPT